MRKDKEKYIKEQCQRIEENAIKNSTKEVYKGVKNLTTKFQPTTDTIKDKDNVILCDRDHVKARWKEYCSNLYKKNENLPMPNTNWQFTYEPPPLLEEIKEAIKDLKIGKSPGNDQVTAEMIKYGGEKVAIFYHSLCKKIWQEKI